MGFMGRDAEHIGRLFLRQAFTLSDVDDPLDMFCDVIGMGVSDSGWI